MRALNRMTICRACTQPMCNTCAQESEWGYTNEEPRPDTLELPWSRMCFKDKKTRIRSKDGRSYEDGSSYYRGPKCRVCISQFKGYLQEGCNGDTLCGMKMDDDKAGYTSLKHFEQLGIERRCRHIRTANWYELDQYGPHDEVCHIGLQCRCDLWGRTHYSIPMTPPPRTQHHFALPAM